MKYINISINGLNIESDIATLLSQSCILCNSRFLP